MCRTTTLVLLVACGASPLSAQQLPDTSPLTRDGDITSQLVDGVDRFLLGEIKRTISQRRLSTSRPPATPGERAQRNERDRRRLQHILGIRDERVAPVVMEVTNRTGLPNPIAVGSGFQVKAVRWPVLADPDPRRTLNSVHGEGLLLEPQGGRPVADIIAVPDADQTPEMIAGLSPGLPASQQFARRLAEAGCRVLIPTLISREREKRNGRANLTNREYLYRSAFELGRHIVGYEMQKIFAGMDWLASSRNNQTLPLGMIGYGEGGMLSLYSAALDNRVNAVWVAGFFGPIKSHWMEPVDRNIFGILEHFGPAELAAMVAPRRVVFNSTPVPHVDLTGEGGAPGKLTSAEPAAIQAEIERAKRLSAAATAPMLIEPDHPSDQVMNESAPEQLLQLLGVDTSTASRPDGAEADESADSSAPDVRATIDVAARQRRQVEEIDRHNQLLLRESPFVRAEYMKQLDTSSVEAYEKTVEAYRDRFRRDVIGQFDHELLPPEPRTRLTWDEPEWTGYEVVLDVFPDVVAYGVLLLPKDLKPGEKRPVVVCQHGLEGRPTDTFLNDHRAYHDFAAELCKRGFITFAPQNLYIFKDRFRTLQRKANTIGRTLFSVIVPQHQQIVNWLKSLPSVDAERIAYYGLSYGGKSAMRIPALVTDYCLSICSADFNEWVRKNASTRHRFSYVWTGEYEIFEFDLGSTFNYAEMAALIAPRPFMVERGHFDGVGTDEWVAYEFAKVRHLYAAKLGIGERCEIEWFVGPHTINGQGTFAFLHRHLNWPQPAAN